MKATIKKNYWHTEATVQFLEILTALTECKEKGTTAMLIAPTGHCKTFSVDKFCEKNPEHTYRITVNSLYRLHDMINEMAALVGVEYQRLTHTIRSLHMSNKVMMDRIVERLRAVKKEGGKPILIIDEGENMEISLLKMIKGLYDVLKDHCAIVLIGTQRLVNRMLNQSDKGGAGRNRSALPELYRRFKAYHKTITPVNPKRDFAPFFKKYIPEEKGLQKLLCTICENYGVLHDYLASALEEADLKGEQLTEEAFRIKYNIQYN